MSILPGDVPENSFELREEWLKQAGDKLKELGGFEYFDKVFGKPNNVHHLSTFWFLKGCGVPSSDFQTLCKLFGFDWREVKEPD